jgi:hypothetical protein
VIQRSLEQFEGTVEILSKIVSHMLQFDRLERFGQEHPLIAASHAALIHQIDAIIVSMDQILIMGAGGHRQTTFGEKGRPCTWEEKLNAISFAFQVENVRLHELMAAETLAVTWGRGGFTRIAEALIRTGGQVVTGIAPAFKKEEAAA